jgi:hypothetical protein
MNANMILYTNLHNVHSIFKYQKVNKKTAQVVTVNTTNRHTNYTFVHLCVVLAVFHSNSHHRMHKLKTNSCKHI